MKHILSLSAVAALAVMFTVSQTGCTEGYVVTSGPGPAYSPYVPYSGGYYGGAGFYHGAYYGNTGYYRNRYGGSAYWNDGSGSAYGARGGSAHWNDGSGSATGWRGSTASWDQGSGHR